MFQNLKVSHNLGLCGVLLLFNITTYYSYHTGEDLTWQRYIKKKTKNLFLSQMAIKWHVY